MKVLCQLLFTLIIMSLISCSDDASDTIVNEGLPGKWSVSFLDGGFAGLNCEYSPGDIIWIFDDTDNFQIIDNISEVDNLCHTTVISPTSSKYGIITQNNRNYLTIDGSEIGEFTIDNELLTINQNESTGGSGADGFTLSLESYE